MSQHSSHHNGNESSENKSDLRKILNEIRYLKINTKVQFSIVEGELHTLRKKNEKEKLTSSHSKENSESSKERSETHSLRVGDYYQPKPHTRLRKERREKQIRVDLPHFHGKNDIDIYLDWEMKVEELFERYNISEERNIPLATLSFQSHEMHWWSALVRVRRLYHEPSIEYWNDHISALRHRHIPSYYHIELMDKLHRLNQRNMSVEEYRQQMKLYMMRAGIREDESVTIARI